MTGWSLYQDINTGLWRCQKDSGRSFWFTTEMQAKQWLADKLNELEKVLNPTTYREINGIEIGPTKGYQPSNDGEPIMPTESNVRKL